MLPSGFPPERELASFLSVHSIELSSREGVPVWEHNTVGVTPFITDSQWIQTERRAATACYPSGACKRGHTLLESQHPSGRPSRRASH